MKDLTVGNESKLILNFALPMLLGNVFQQLYNVVDSIVVGQFLGKAALAAVGITMPLIFTLISLIVGLSIGFNVIIAQYFGAKDYKNVQRTVDTMNIILFISSAIFTIVGLLLMDNVLTLIKTPADIHVQAIQYLRVYLLGLVFFFGYNGNAAIYRGMGDSKTPLYFIILSTILNIGLDLLFVAVFDWGIEGAAWATIIAQGIAFITSIFYINKFHDFLKFKFWNFSFDSYIMKKSIQIGLPTALQQSFVALGMVALLSVVNAFGTDVVAAYSIATRIESFVALPAMNFAAALSTFVGQNIGAQKIDRVKKGYFATLKMTLLITIVSTLIILIFSYPLTRLFTEDLAVINISRGYLNIVSFFFVFFTAMFVNSGVLRGAGDTLIPMFITLFSLWVIRIPLAYLMSKSFGYIGIWWAIPVAWFFGMLFSYSYYKIGRWKNKSVVKKYIPTEEIDVVAEP
ncbi:MAG: MATE family efflux transporter [Bacteroidales bacterium]|jgi:putative MATE family efflux protein|nr:MATE family efflux transporter [Bacteroidales bacterium]